MRIGAIIFSSITSVGQVVYGFGGILNQFWMMQFGRFIFGSVNLLRIMVHLEECHPRVFERPKSEVKLI